ncbi:MAG TPA: hypothetical protein VMP03_07665 [Methylomirabilota bacterium]|nr:hypothetical protein [Methylomirabilota bacterium]
MTDIRLNDETASGTSFVTDEHLPAAGRGSAMSVAIAAAVAVLIAIFVAAALTGPVAAAPTEAAAPAAAADFGVRTANLLVDAPVRDAVYFVVSPETQPGKSMAMVLLTGLLLAMGAGTSVAWRALQRSVVRPVHRRGRTKV